MSRSIETILEGRHRDGMDFAKPMEPFPVGWQEQRLLIFEANS